MINKVFIFSSLILLTACNNATENKVDFKKEIIKLEQQLAEKQRNKESLITSNNSFLEEVIIEEKNSEENYISKELVSILSTNDFNYIIDHKKLATYFFDGFHLNDSDVDSALNFNNFLLFPNPNTHMYSDKYGFASYILSKIDRSPESLSKILTPEVKETAYTLLKNNNLYKKSGSYAMVKAAILMYDDVKNDDYFLSDLYRRASGGNSDYDGYDDTPDFSARASEEIKEVLSQHNYSPYANEWSTVNTRLSTLYFFLARRHHEGNLDYTYTLFKELHEELTDESFHIEPLEIEEIDGESL